MSTGTPHYAADRSKSRKSNNNRSIPFRTPTTQKVVKTSIRLGPVNPPTPTRNTQGGHGFSAEFLEYRRRRQERHTVRLAKLPNETLIIGGANPFDARNVPEAIKKFRDLVDEKIGDKVHKKDANKSKIVFREEEEETQNGTITID
ncbi:uncharacterized protein CELE_C34E10.9 [Caenorhabditis elegans]|uniref:Uncharacterized protein C34E10.9 n=1 Tax=Caenorhabditis elegans TaxID=6239 RepID=YLB9_CAEEL|nr:Uncharacterized protein CELE_C34E10.9 [Caenorhabditis elegans]P46583.2 RecName: Full=Uncharacterized protein C34E10.9 [Caenorhabditis elegans]CCD66653.2 Uncharacterized protein CELE_C34E10.9 [Caenorhabditis elegans]|eukprot:NP_498120.2 Uncharacterized protein CELE_C34E10.9 [Caenorhabditis elegans]